ncbi:MAG: hypothetical protein K6G91_01445, partial [Kiritimatiellae bacterium]|nr:hypothetical protein [Kiritimatiellia bacterium]
YHLISRLAHRAFFLDDEEKDRAVALMRRVEAGVKASMSYCINRTVSIGSDPFAPPFAPLSRKIRDKGARMTDLTRKELNGIIGT